MDSTSTEPEIVWLKWYFWASWKFDILEEDTIEIGDIKKKLGRNLSNSGENPAF